MLNISTQANLSAVYEANPASQAQRQQQHASAEQSAALIQSLQAPIQSREGFLEEAQRLTLLARMGVDIDTLNDIEGKIEQLESIETRNKEQQSELESLLEQRKQLFRDAMERKNGENLPAGSIMSFHV